MTNKKKIILFLGAVSLVAFGNYRQFIDNNKGKTTVEGKASEKATSSAGRNSKESKASEKATSSKGGKTVEKTVPPSKIIGIRQILKIRNQWQKQNLFSRQISQ